MIRITYELSTFLVKNSRDSKLSAASSDPRDLYIPRNTHAIGFADPFISVGADFDYLVICDCPMPESQFFTSYIPEVEGYWLCQRSELKKPDELIQVPRHSIDFVAPEDTDDVDITDCCVADIPGVDRLTCPAVTTLKRLLELEPDLRKCLNEKVK